MNTISLSIWVSATVLYLLFLIWHENWRGSLSEAEIEHFMKRIEANEGIDKAQRQALLDFMQNDTGREFLMINFVKYQPGKIPHPTKQTQVSGPRLLQDYFRPFAGMIFRNAGYPAYSALLKGDYIEAWGVQASPGWEVAGLIRYRSRRDMLRAATDPAFASLHIYKRAALAVTFAVPAETNGGMFFSPRRWVALLLAALAAFAQLAYLTFRTSNG